MMKAKLKLTKDKKMQNKTIEFYQGVALAKIIREANKAISILAYKKSSYILDNKVAIYIKHSHKRMSPWRFTFDKEHQAEINELKSKYIEVFLILVCGEDGSVSLDHDEIKKILDNEHEENEWVSVTRRKNHVYGLKGSNGQLDYKVSRQDFAKRIYKTLK